MPDYFIWIIAVLALLLIWLFVARHLRSKRKLKGKDAEFVRKRWQEIRNLEIEKAVLEADKLLDHALYKLGFEGSLGEKLKKSGARFPNIDDVWYVHKMRNKIAHEVGFKLSQRDSDKVLKIYNKALDNLLSPNS